MFFMYLNRVGMIVFLVIVIINREELVLVNLFKFVMVSGYSVGYISE